METKAHLTKNHVLRQPHPPIGSPWSEEDWALLRSLAAGKPVTCEICKQPVSVVFRVPWGIAALCEPHFQILQIVKEIFDVRPN